MAGTSKVPPEFGQAAFQRAGVQRQEVSDVVVTHTCASDSVIFREWNHESRRKAGGVVFFISLSLEANVKCSTEINKQQTP